MSNSVNVKCQVCGKAGTIEYAGDGFTEAEANKAGFCFEDPDLCLDCRDKSEAGRNAQPGLYHPKNTYLEGIQLDGSCCRCDQPKAAHRADGYCPLQPLQDAHILLKLIGEVLAHPGHGSVEMYILVEAAGRSIKALVEQLDAGAVAGRSGMPSPGTAYARANRLRLEIASTESNLLRMREKVEEMEKAGEDVRNARKSIARFEIMVADWRREYELNTLALRIYGKEGV